MATKAQKIRLSVFLIISSIILLSFFLVLVGSRIMRRMDPYYIVYEGMTVTGLEPGDNVLLSPPRIIEPEPGPQVEETVTAVAGK